MSAPTGAASSQSARSRWVEWCSETKRTLRVVGRLVGVLALVLLPKRHEHHAKWIAAFVCAVVLACVIGLFVAYDRDKGGYQFVTETTWTGITSRIN